jgi:hypothetical protein
MRRRGLSAFLAVLFALILTGPVLAQDATPPASPAADDEPTINLIAYGALGVASREYEQTGEDLDYVLFYSTSLAAFPNEETAEDAFPQIVEEMMALPAYKNLDEVQIDPVGDEQIFVSGEAESGGFTFNLGVLVVRDGAYLTLAAGLGYETLDVTDSVVELSTFLGEQATDASPETADDLLDLLPEPEELPGADAIQDPYEISDENVRRPTES